LSEAEMYFLGGSRATLQEKQPPEAKHIPCGGQPEYGFNQTYKEYLP